MSIPNITLSWTCYYCWCCILLNLASARHCFVHFMVHLPEDIWLTAGLAMLWYFQPANLYGLLNLKVTKKRGSFLICSLQCHGTKREEESENSTLTSNWWSGFVACNLPNPKVIVQLLDCGKLQFTYWSNCPASMALFSFSSLHQSIL